MSRPVDRIDLLATQLDRVSNQTTELGLATAKAISGLLEHQMEMQAMVTALRERIEFLEGDGR